MEVDFDAQLVRTLAGRPHLDRHVVKVRIHMYAVDLHCGVVRLVRHDDGHHDMLGASCAQMGMVAPVRIARPDGAGSIHRLKILGVRPEL